MDYDRLKAFHERRPFHPFEITTNDGLVYTVGQPEFLAQSPTRRYVMLETDAGRVVTLKADQIAAVEPVNAPAARRPAHRGGADASTSAASDR